jgi:hypothetical protein
MPNPSKPIEQKRALGNPGKRALKQPAEYIEGGYVEPMRKLKDAGMSLWDSAMKTGEQWIARNTDTQLLLVTCEQMDRREVLMTLWRSNPTDKNVLMRLAELEKLIALATLACLASRRSDRSRLGLAEIKAKSKLQELMEPNG